MITLRAALQTVRIAGQQPYVRPSRGQPLSYLEPDATEPPVINARRLLDSTRNRDPGHVHGLAKPPPDGNEERDASH